MIRLKCGQWRRSFGVTSTLARILADAIQQICPRCGVFVGCLYGRAATFARLPTIWKAKCYPILPTIFDYKREGDSTDSSEQCEALEEAA